MNIFLISEEFPLLLIPDERNAPLSFSFIIKLIIEIGVILEFSFVEKNLMTI